MPEPTWVLLVDDDDAVYLGYQHRFRNTFGDSVVLKHCQNEKDLEDSMNGHSFSVVILDQKLSNGIEGLDLVPRIRSASPTSQILVNSAFGSEKLAAKAIAAGADGYILGQKSDDDLLIAAVGEAIQARGIVQDIIDKANGQIAPLRRRCDAKLAALKQKISNNGSKKG